MQLEQHYIAYVKQTVDKLVTDTKFPVATKVLEEVGIADRSKLRKLERMGVLKRMQVTTGNGHINAYYTEDALPKFEIERRAKADAELHQDAGGRGEVGESEGNSQEAVRQERGRRRPLLGAGNGGIQAERRAREQSADDPTDERLADIRPSEVEDENDQRASIKAASDKAIRQVSETARDYEGESITQGAEPWDGTNILIDSKLTI